MKITINSSSYLNTIQQEFNQLFPDLKLVYSFQGNEKLNLSANLRNSFPHVRIRELSHNNTPNSFIIDGTMTVSEVESLFKAEFGLPVQVYIKQGIYWLKSSIYNTFKLQKTV